MITIIVDAARIPNGTTVRKVNGSNTYTLQREIKVYMPEDNRKIEAKGIVFLVGESAINGYPESTRFAVDLDEDDAFDFLKKVII